MPDTNKIRITLFMVIALALAACRQEPDVAPSPTPPSVPETPAQTTTDVKSPTEESEGSEIEPFPLLISEVLPGTAGANSREFIELHNATLDVVDLDGWSLWYVTRDDQEATPVYRWRERTEVPGLGHYLLVHDGAEFGLLADALYDTAMFEGKGGLNLRNAEGEVVDRLGWGEAPQEYYAGSPIKAFEPGQSLERLPGGIMGNGSNSENNAADFVSRQEPDPQNSGSPPTPLPEQRLEISLADPQPASPGQEFDLTFNVSNLSDAGVSDVLVSMPLAEYFTVAAAPEGATVANGRVTWPIQSIDQGETITSQLTLTAPFANVDTVMSGYYAESTGLPRAYGALKVVSMDGSAIPIEVARSLPEGSMVTVEGVVTMYPGGFFAGSSSAKFYLEDETGGVQIFADGGLFDVDVNIGDRARATGRTELFRDSLEVIPVNNVMDIQVLERAGPPPKATEITIPANEEDDAVLGRLNMLEGTAVRIEEFTFHYEIDLMDEDGNTTLLYAEKDTGITDESLQLGSKYQVTGISEFASGVRQLKPRLPSDLVELFPPVLLLEASAPSNILPGETMTVSITAVNHTDEPMSNIHITAEIATGDSQEWLIPELAGQGASESVSFSFQAPDDAAGTLDIGTISAISDQWAERVTAQPNETFIGRGVPIWAIQGTGSRSPLIGQRVTAVGQVTGVFPEMGGFFLQSLEPDGDPATSDGIFVSTSGLSLGVQLGDSAEVTGRVREDAGQTILRPALPADILVLDEEDRAGIDPVIYDPPADPDQAAAYKEALEGMLVAIEEPAVVIAPTNRFGEYALVYEKWDTDRVRRSDGPVGFVMWVDDGTFNTHEDQSTLPVAVARGDTLAQIAGPLAYTFGNYKIAPTESPEIELPVRPLPSIPEASGNQVSVATFNVENLFDSKIPHPADLPRLSEEQYQRRLSKVADAIVYLGAPTILALQEVENIEVIQGLAAQPQLDGYDYVPILLEGNDSRGIDVAYLVRGDRATVDGFAIHDAPNQLFSRPPLVLTTTVHLDAGDQQIILLNNHFLSLAAGELQTEAVRSNQAAWNAVLIEQLQANNPDGRTIVLGDLNSFYRTEPLDILQESGLRHVYEYFMDEDDIPYTYIFDGATQTLDHILVSESLFEDLTLVEALHINADYPIAGPDDPLPWRVSDHDPLLAIFTID